MEQKHAIQALAALAHEARLRIFRALVVAGQQGATPSVLCAQLDIAANTLSFHLKELVQAQLLSQERQGRQIIYRATFPTMNALIAYLTENCCQGKPCTLHQPTSN